MTRAEPRDGIIIGVSGAAVNKNKKAAEKSPAAGAAEKSVRRRDKDRGKDRAERRILCYDTVMEMMNETLRHLGDLYRRAERQGTYTYSGFLSPAGQAAFLAEPPRGTVAYAFEGGAPAAERRILIFGSENDFGYLPEPPIKVLAVRPAAEKFAESLSHRDCLGAVLALGIERELVGDIIVRGKSAYVLCLEQIADYIRTNLTEVRHTQVRVSVEDGPVPELAPVLREEQLNVASERLDAVVAAFCGLARGKADARRRKRSSSTTCRKSAATGA